MTTSERNMDMDTGMDGTATPVAAARVADSGAQADPPRDFLLCPPRDLPLHAIMGDVCGKYRITMTDLKSRRQDRQACLARQEYFWRARHETTASLPMIGRSVDRDHTTVMHGIVAHERRISRGSPSFTQSTG